MSFLKYQDATQNEEILDPVSNLPIYQRMSSCWIDPTTRERHRVSASYYYNEKFVNAVENDFLRLPMYNENILKKEEEITELINKELSSRPYQMGPIITGLKFTTITADGQIQWEYYDDPDSALDLVLTARVPDRITRIHFQDLEAIESLSHEVAFTAEYLGVTYFVKAHTETLHNISFMTELEARIKIGNIPHVCPMIAIIIQDSAADGQSYVQGMLLQYESNGSLEEVLRYSNPPIEPAIKERWAAQIAHGIALIHRAGVLHGDLRCENIMVNKDNDILIIDISNGSAFKPGWLAELDHLRDPRCDVYSLGVVIWELIHDAEKLPSIGCELPIDGRGEKHSKSFVSLIGDCHVEFADKRASLSNVIDRLGGSDKCGCHLH